MWEETVNELELESRPRKSIFNNPFIQERMDSIIVFGIIVCSALFMISAVKFHLFAYWSDFLRSSKFLRVATYPLVISAVTVFAALIMQTFLWAKYKPMTVPGKREPQSSHSTTRFSIARGLV